MCAIEANSAIKDARRTLANHRAELTKELQRLTDAIKALDTILEEQPRPVVAPRQRKPASRLRRSGGQKSVVKPAVLAVLRESGDWMHANDILATVEQRGLSLSAKDPKATIVTALLRMAKEGLVEKEGGNSFRIAGAGHIDSQSDDRIEDEDATEAGSESPEASSVYALTMPLAEARA